ncbi:hypothetical protein ACFOZ0_26440 [Streptomyces yaanensis]|uniref:Uncharacterized protein n=1 Tax=Streptomyces yaanensis TaxID=1142239 RepID=A0ABV7SK98_9ACTN|nr:hypothetical protein [Streptomyces sp. CGMCC 4.7035]WNC01714.1 hypothetical protein Q2K21_28645 [Streptomyces sp. CGMCC 4.7035]
MRRWTLGPATGGVHAEVLNLGAGLHAPDRDGASADVVLSPRDPARLLGGSR